MYYPSRVLHDIDTCAEYIYIVQRASGEIIAFEDRDDADVLGQLENYTPQCIAFVSRVRKG